MTHQFLQLPYGYPPEIKEWASSFLLTDKSLLSDRHNRIVAILTDREVKKAAKHVFSKIQHSPNWPSNFTDFIDRVSDVPNYMPGGFYTPKMISTKLQSLVTGLEKLIDQIEEYDDILLVPNLNTFSRELTDFKNGLNQQIDSLLNKSVGPTLSREDGTKAEDNWCARQIGTLAIVHLEELFPVFTAAVTRALIGRKFGLTESTIRDLFKA